MVPSSPPSRVAALGAALITIAALPGCGTAPDPEGRAGEAPQPLAGRPQTLAPDEVPPPLNGITGSAGPASPPPSGQAADGAAGDASGDLEPANPKNATGADAADGANGGRPGASQERPFTVVTTLTDRRDDQGLEGPAYADIVAVTIGDNGASARVTVDVAQNIPARLRSGEVMGVGVDLWRDRSRRESDYQLFAEGGEDGWFAHLHTPRGLVDYPGEFRLGGRRLVFQVPWRHLGDVSTGGFRAFADWSKRRVALNAASQDRAPDKGPAPFRR